MRVVNTSEEQEQKLVKKHLLAQVYKGSKAELCKAVILNFSTKSEQHEQPIAGNFAKKGNFSNLPKRSYLSFKILNS